MCVRSFSYRAAGTLDYEGKKNAPREVERGAPAILIVSSTRARQAAASSMGVQAVSAAAARSRASTLSPSKR